MKRLAPLYVFCTLASSGCDSKPADTAPAEASEKPAEPADTVRPEEPAEPAEPAVPAKAIAGTYTSGAVTLKIFAVTAKNFGFSLNSPDSNSDDEPCAGISYDGVGTRNPADANKATTGTPGDYETEGTMRFGGSGVHFEPAMSMIGNDCMRRLDVDFKKSAK